MPTGNLFTTGQAGATMPITDYSVAQNQLMRQQAMADLLRKQALEPMGDTQTIGGWAIKKSPLEGLAKMAQALGANYAQNQTDDQGKKLAADYQAGAADTMKRGMETQYGKPASLSEFVPDTFDASDKSDNLPGAMANINPAVAGDPAAAASIYMSHPATQQMGVQVMADVRRNAMLSQILGGTPGATGGASVPGSTGGVSGSSALGIDPKVLGLMLSGDSSLEGIGKMLQETNKPIALREGDLVRPDGKGGYTSAYQSPKMEPGMLPTRGANGQVTGATAIPGYKDAITDIKGAEAGAVSGAQSENKLIPVDTPNGKVLMTEKQAVEAAVGKPANNVGNLRPQGASTGFQKFGTPEEGLAAVDKNLQAYGSKGVNTLTGIINRWAPPSENDTKAYISDVSKRLSLNPDQPLDMNNPVVRHQLSAAIIGHEQGYSNLFGAPKQAGIPLQGEGGRASEIERGKFFGTNYADLQKGAMDANAKIAKIDRISSLLDGVNTGKLTPAGTELAAYAQSMGFNIDPKLGNKQAAKALSNEIALQLRNPSGGAGMPGAMSDKDREFLMSMTPSLGNTPEGNILLIDGMRKLAQRDQQVAQLAREYKGGNLDNGFYQVVQDYANKNPIFSQQAQPKGTGVATAAPARNAQGWALHTDAKGNKAYVSPDGKQFKEVK